MADVGVVVLSMGHRPAELGRALRSLLGQRDVALDVVVVGNGWEPEGLPPGVRSIALATNVGVPEGRNVGAAAVAGEVLLFFDDDLEIDDDRMLARACDAFAADPRLGVLQPRSVDPTGGPTARRHVPRPGARDPGRSGDVAWFWEGCSFVRRVARSTPPVGGPATSATATRASSWPGGSSTWATASATRLTSPCGIRRPSRSAAPRHQYMNARNRVWVARRNLPHPLLEIYVLVWAVVTFARARSRSAVAAALRGFIAGVRQPAGERRPISWRAAWRMTRLGRPPVV